MNLIRMSVSGAIMILVILFIRALFLKRLPKRTFPVLWGVVLARLLIPYSLPSAFSVYSLRLLFARKDAAQKAPSVSPPPVPDPPLQGAGDIPAPAPSNSLSLEGILAIVWAVGVLALAVFFTVSYIKCVRRFSESLPVDNEFIAQWLSQHKLRRKISVRSYDRISSPLTYGIFRPVILLPKALANDETTDLNYVLFHEYVHIRRFDLGLKLLLTAALCVHWLNPLVWIMYFIANRDIEISCDEAVLRHFGEDSKSDYAMALIRMEEKRSGITPLPTRFSKRPIEERIVTIMKFKKATTISIAAAVFLTLGTTAAFATTAQQNDEPAGQTTGVVEPISGEPSDSSTSELDTPVSPVTSSDSSTSELDTPVLPDTSSDSSETSDNSAEEPSSSSETSLPPEIPIRENDPQIPPGTPVQVEDHGDHKIVFIGWDEDDTEHLDSAVLRIYEDVIYVYRMDRLEPNTSSEPVEVSEYTHCSFTGEVFICG